MLISETRKYGFNVFVDNAVSSINDASQNGMKYVELNFSVEKSPIEVLTEDKINTIKTIAEEKNISLSFHIPYTVNISDIIPAFRKKSIKSLRQYVQLANLIGAGTITIHPGIFYWFPVEKMMRERALNRLVKGLKELVAICEELNVQIALENLVPIPQGSEFFFLGDNIKDFELIFNEIDSDIIGFCLDTGHANIAEGPIEYVKALGDRMLNIHYHDNHGKNDNHMILGEGNIHWEELTKHLLACNYKGAFISECRNIAPNEAAKIMENYFNGSS